MIPLAIRYGFIVYVCFWMITLVVLWAWEMFRSKAYDWVISEDRLCLCDNCHYTFLLQPHVNITRCPRCNDMFIYRKRR